MRYVSESVSFLAQKLEHFTKRNERFSDAQYFQDKNPKWFPLECTCRLSMNTASRIYLSSQNQKVNISE